VNLPAVVTALRQLADALEGKTANAGADVLTTAELGARLHRSASTIRGWCEAGRFVGAFKLNGRDWRIPIVAVETFVAGQAHQPRPITAAHRDPPRSTITRRRDATKGQPARLGAWRTT
jgi:hypothetical protein